MRESSLPLVAALATLALALASTSAGAAPLATGISPAVLLSQGSLAALASPSAPVTGRDWILKTADNICGLRDPNQLTYPALIDFDACLEATPEFKRIHDQGIDLKSAEGIQLRSAAVTRLTNACESVRNASGHCSVWKEIRHKDGRAIPDISSQVIALF